METIVEELAVMQLLFFIEDKGQHYEMLKRIKNIYKRCEKFCWWQKTPNRKGKDGSLVPYTSCNV
jgi:hypothetical protein